MEGSESVFDSLNLNPQLFINEVLNVVDDVVDDAFVFFNQEASIKLNSEAADRSQDLTKGVDIIREVIQSVLDKRLAIWEKYSLHHCFAVPQGFVLPKSDESTGDDSMCGDLLSSPDIDVQLDSLRKKVAAIGKESEMLNQELKALESQHTSSAGYINELLQSYEQNSSPELFEEVMATASELGMKIGKLNSSIIEETERTKAETIYNAEMNLYTTKWDHAKGFPNVKQGSFQDFLVVMKNM